MPHPVFFSCLLGSHSDAWCCCSSKAGTLDTLTDPGDIHLFMQVVLRDALNSPSVMSLAFFSLFSYLFTLARAISLPCVSVRPRMVLGLALESISALQAGEKPQKHLVGLEGIDSCCARSGSTSDPEANKFGDTGPQRAPFARAGGGCRQLQYKLSRI